MTSKSCFLNMYRPCTDACAAYVDKGNTNCRLVNSVEKLVPVPARPTAPPPVVK